MPTSPDRQFSDREAALILRSAAELQESEVASGHAVRGLSLAQLEQIAAEAGIDAAMVRRAAAGLDADARLRDNRGFLGAPEQVVVERTVKGELGVDRFDALLDSLRMATGKLGEASIVGRLFGWKGHIEGARAEVAVTPVDGQTTVRVRLDLEETAVGHFMLKGMFGGVGGGLASATVGVMMFGGPVGAAMGAAVLGGGYLWARRGFSRAAARYHAHALRVADAVASAAAAALGSTDGATR